MRIVNIFLQGGNRKKARGTVVFLFMKMKNCTFADYSGTKVINFINSSHQKNYFYENRKNSAIS